jgi:hypothetical protein
MDCDNLPRHSRVNRHGESHGKTIFPFSGRLGGGTERNAVISFPAVQKPKLLDQVRHAIRTRH